MKLLIGFPGWGWKMYGLASFRSGRMWFVGLSKQLPKVGADDTAEDLNKCHQCGGEVDNGHDLSYPPTAYLCSKCTELHNVEGEARLPALDLATTQPRRLPASPRPAG